MAAERGLGVEGDAGERVFQVVGHDLHRLFPRVRQRSFFFGEAALGAVLVLLFPHQAAQEQRDHRAEKDPEARDCRQEYENALGGCFLVHALALVYRRNMRFEALERFVEVACPRAGHAPEVGVRGLRGGAAAAEVDSRLREGRHFLLTALDLAQELAGFGVEV